MGWLGRGPADSFVQSNAILTTAIVLSMHTRCTSARYRDLHVDRKRALRGVEQLGLKVATRGEIHSWKRRMRRPSSCPTGTIRISAYRRSLTARQHPLSTLLKLLQWHEQSVHVIAIVGNGTFFIAAHPIAQRQNLG